MVGCSRRELVRTPPDVVASVVVADKCPSNEFAIDFQTLVETLIVSSEYIPKSEYRVNDSTDGK